MNETISQPLATLKPKRQLTEAQMAALKKGREALAEKRRTAQKEELNEVVEIDPDNHPPDTVKTICVQVSIILASYFIMFVICQQL